ncbi:hypothetical protein OWR29_00915 [Actinoplanes sp. Pm04-4]|uniref:Protoporphyrinogen oxidase n=1 Tax=Paractinoplanes pyxinae TaxID=2997416 RepID=A0ABT4AS43_9ACTN|nr:hypothetical protein [Actinoplanes pyxinae]MCY1136540.1 hypothetical protein [Actinoplanes pyxinae]
MRVIKLATGLAIGYVLGSRAGREKYDQIVATARKARRSASTPAQDEPGTAPAAGADEPAASAALVVTDVQETVVVTDAPRTPPRRRPKGAATTTIAPGDL